MPRKYNDVAQCGDPDMHAAYVAVNTFECIGRLKGKGLKLLHQFLYQVWAIEGRISAQVLGDEKPTRDRRPE